MDPIEDGLPRFSRFIESFQCERVPCDLLIRACEPKPTWSSSGEVVEKLPLEAGVPEWLLDFYNSHRSLFHDPDYGAHLGGMEIIHENGVPYLEVGKGKHPELELNQCSSITDERSLAHDRIAVFLHAFPSINIEIIGEEIVDRLTDIATRSILPLLLCVTDGDITDWLLPRNYGDSESCLVSLFEFLYQINGILGVEHPLLPLSLPKRILNVVPCGTQDDTIATLQNIAHTFEHIKHKGQNLLEYKPLTSEMTSGERGHAILGYVLSLQNMHSADTLTTWQPLLIKSPSQMEYLAAISFYDQSRLTLLQRPAFLTLDTRVLEGLLLSRRKQHEQAAKALEATRVELVSQYGPCSMQFGMVTAELANCYNVLRREAQAKSILVASLKSRLDSSLSNRRDGVYLRLALSDSFIGQAKYEEAVPLLESIMGNPDISATFRMMSVLRLTKSRRRTHDDAQNAFKQSSPLWTGLALLGNVPEVLVMEFLEELGCCISQIPKLQLSEPNTTQLIGTVDSVLRKSRSILDSPCFEWYINIQQEYFERVAKAAKKNKGKKKDMGSQNEDKNAMGAPMSYETSLRLRTLADVDISDDKGLWLSGLALSFAEGGVRALSCLIILKRLMHRIRELELHHPDGPAFASHEYPWMQNRGEEPVTELESDRLGDFLPCHYFDFMAGTSTGGLVSIMLGRLRMSVDEATDNFLNFGNEVFGQPRLFHTTSPYFPSRAKYSGPKAREAVSKIVSSSDRFVNRNYSGWKGIVQDEAFRENRLGTRTIVLTQFEKVGITGQRIWRSYDNHNIGAPASLPVTILDAACTTYANPFYFDKVEMNGAKYFDGPMGASYHSGNSLREFYSSYGYPPAAFVSIGAIPFKQVWTKINRDEHDSTPKQLQELARVIKLQHLYRFDGVEYQHQIPYDDWRPAATGQITLEAIKYATNKYLEKENVKHDIDSIARMAVSIRRERVNTERWEEFAMDLEYICPICLSPQVYELRAQLRAHLGQYHAEINECTRRQAEATLDKGRRNKTKRMASV